MKDNLIVPFYEDLKEFSVNQLIEFFEETYNALASLEITFNLD